MTHYLVSNIPFYQQKLTKYELSVYIDGLFISLCCGEIVGVSALLFTIAVLYNRYEQNERISFFVVFVLLNDLLELVLNPYIMANLEGDTLLFQALASVWSGSRICGVHLQQMVVFESVLAVRPSLTPTSIYSSVNSVVISVVAYLCFCLCAFFRAPAFLLFSLLPLLAVTANSWIVTFRKPPLKLPSTSKGKKREYALLSFATLTLTLYLNFLSVYIFLRTGGLWICVCLMTVRVITDPLVCLLAYKEKHIDLSTDQTSVAEQSA